MDDNKEEELMNSSEIEADTSTNNSIEEKTEKTVTQKKNMPVKTNNKKDKKPSLFSRFATKVTEIRGEFRKIIWPTRRELVKQTVTVIITCIFFGIIIVSMDGVFSFLLRFLTSVVAGGAA